MLIVSHLCRTHNQNKLICFAFSSIPDDVKEKLSSFKSCSSAIKRDPCFKSYSTLEKSSQPQHSARQGHRNSSYSTLEKSSQPQQSLSPDRQNPGYSTLEKSSQPQLPQGVMVWQYRYSTLEKSSQPQQRVLCSGRHLIELYFSDPQQKPTFAHF